MDGAGNSDEIKARVGQIRSQIENTTSEYDKGKRPWNVWASWPAA